MKIKPIFTSILLSIFLLQLHATIPAGYYYLAQGKSKSDLKTALKNVSSPLSVLGYGGSGIGFTWQGFYYTDRKADSTVVDMYSSIIRKQPDFNSVDGMHIEHSFPKSWWGGYEYTAYKDLFHLYPADGTTNSTKSNLPLGEVSGTPTFDNGKSKIGKNGFGTAYSDYCFEPADEYKGDFARSYLYITTIYEDYAPLWQSPMLNNNTYPVWKPWAIELLKKWHTNDPVSQKELDRNEAIYAIQGNRNPFIDYPTLVNYIWGADSVSVFPFPTENNPFLTSPRRGTKIDFGTIMTGSQQNHIIQLKGINFSSAVNFTLKTNSVQLSKTSANASELTNGTTLSVQFTPVIAGQIRDTLIIADGGLSAISIPITGNATPDFMVLEPTEIHATGAKLNWISDPAATDYQLKVYEQTQKAGDLIFSSYVEGTSWNKAIEIFNGTGQTVNLANYSLRKQSNGDGSFGSELKLSGMLANNSCHTIVHKNATLSPLLSKADLLTDTLLQISGNDAIALYRNGISIDMMGSANAGADIIWGLDVSLQRKNHVTHPRTNYNNSEWNFLPQDSVAFLDTHSMILSPTTPNHLINALTGNVNFYNIENLSPDKIYYYTVDAIKNNSSTAAYNSMQLTTPDLEAPELLPASNITDKSFTANWANTAYATGYAVEVLDIVSTGNNTERNGFDNVGSGGTPLPTGWSSSAISTYTSTTSSGIAAPSLQLNDNNDWVMTREYEYPVTSLAFMYRFASAATGSSLTLEALQNGTWIPVINYSYTNTIKTNKLLNFDAALNYRKFRFTYTKVTGNLAIDDVVVTYGKTDSTIVAQGTTSGTTSFNVTGLQPNSVYFYRVKSALGSTYSPYSELMEVKTTEQTGISDLSINLLRIFKQNAEIIVINNETIQQLSVTDINGRKILTDSNKKTFTIKLPKRGIYIIQLTTGNNTIFRKISY